MVKFTVLSSTMTQIDKMEAKVVQPLLDYESVCRKARVRMYKLSGWLGRVYRFVDEGSNIFSYCREISISSVPKPRFYIIIVLYIQDELKSTRSVGEREVTKQRGLDRVKIRDPANRKKIVSLIPPPDIASSSGPCLGIFFVRS